MNANELVEIALREIDANDRHGVIQSELAKSIVTNLAMEMLEKQAQFIEKFQKHLDEIEGAAV